MFRDGVGDGQLKYATEWEIPQLMSCFSVVSPTYAPKLTVVIVQKRINCRIFHQLVSILISSGIFVSGLRSHDGCY